jgi:surface protein
MGIVAKYKFNQNTYESFIPEFNSEFNNYTITDEIDTDGYTIRTIESNNLPTLMQFGNNVSTNKTKSLLSILKCNTENITSMRYMFSRCEKLTSLDLSNFNTSKVTDMGHMFFGCSKLTSLDLSSFNTSRVTDMGHMFNGCSKLTSLDLSNFDTGKVTNMDSIFGGWTSDQTVYISSKWTLGEDFPPTFKSPSVVAKYRFTSATDTLPNFNSGYVYIVSDEDNGDGTTTRTISSVTAPTSINFNGREGLLEVYELDVSGLTSFAIMFQGCNKVTKLPDMTGWCTDKITSLNSMFYRCNTLSSVIGLNTWDTSNVTNTSTMFRNCNQIKEIDMSGWDMRKNTTMSMMFRDTTGVTHINTKDWKWSSNSVNMTYMFQGCNSLQTIEGIEDWDVTNVTSFLLMFSNCKKLNMDVSTWRPQKVTSMQQTFTNCSSLTSLDLSAWNVSSVTTINSCFSGCTKLQTLNLGGWNISKLTNMNYGFSSCTNLTELNLSGWDTTTVTAMSDVFSNDTNLISVIMNECSVNTINSIISILPTRSADSYGTISSTVDKDEASNIDTTTATSKFWNMLNRFPIARYKFTTGIDTLPTVTPNNIQYTDIINEDDTTTRTIYNTESPKTINFGSKTGLLEVYELDITNKINNLTNLFYNCSSLISVNTLNWDTSAVTSMQNTFRGCTSLTSLDVSNFKTGSVTSMATMFYQCGSLTSLDVSNWDVSKTTNMNSTFNSCGKITSLDVSKWNVGKLANMASMFYGCSSLTSLDTSQWDTSSATNMDSMFIGCTSLSSLDVSNFKTGSVTSIASMFKNCSSLTFLDVSKWDVGKVTTFSATFQGCSNLETLDVSKWDTSSASIFQNTFASCSKLTSLNVDKWNTSNATNMGGLFNGCSSLTSLDLSSFTTNQVTYLRDIFNFCSNLQMLDLSNFNTDIVTDTTRVFGNCTALKDIGLVYCNASTVNTLASLVPTNVECNVYYYDADETQLVKPDNVNYVKYVFPANIQLPPHIELRSVGEVRDEVDLETGILIKRIEVDENGYPFILEEPIEERIILNYTNSCDYGRILPTGTYDKYNVVTGEYYQTMTTILLDGKNVWSEMEEMTNTIKFTATGETVEIEELNMLGAGGLYCDNDLFPNINDDSDVEHCCVDEEGDKFYIYISKERLMSPDLIGYQIWLQQNKFNMTYELAVPQNIIKPYEELDSTQARWDTLDSMRDCVIYLMSTDKDDDFIITPTFEYITPSSNNFYLDLLLPNTEYTVYAEGISEEIDTINLGGITTPYTRACLMTSGDNKWVTFDNNETFDKVMIIKGNSQNEFIKYFKGIGNIDNPTITIVNEDESQQSQVSYPDVHLRSLPTGERDYFDAILGIVTQNVGVRPFEDGDLENMDLITDGINTLYPLTEPTTQYVAPQPLLAYDNGKIKITSDTGLVTTLTYAVPFSNTYRLPHLKTGTLYTIKYPSASGTITIGDITYRITSDSMLFTTPLVINGDTSAIIFSDENPQNVILLEGGYSNREVAYFAGIKSVSNPIITIIDNTVENPENVEYKPTNEIELRSLPNGIADLLDIVKQKVTISVGYRHYQEGDEYLDNVWTDGYNTAYALENPVVRDVEFVTPVISTNSTMKLSSNGLIPQLNYRVPSTNNFPLDLLLPNTTYTLYGQADTSITYSLGGVYNSTLMGAEVISLGNTKNNLLTFNGDISSANVMLVKGNTTGISVPYFQGVKSVNNIDFIIEGLQGEQNTMSLQNNVSLRACGNIKDSIDMTTCILTRELGEVVLRGNESWFSLEEIESINVDYVLFGCIVGGAANSQSTSVICNRFNHKYLSGSLHQQECVYCTDNQVRICIKKTTIGGNNITALKTWLEQNNVSVIYALRTPLSEKLTSVWETMPPTSYNNQTTITTQTRSNTPKPMITITVATTTLEQIISELQLQNAQLENENIATMLALADVYETMVAPMAVMSLNSDPYAMSTMSLDDEEPATNVVGYTVSPMGMVYAKLVHKGLKTMYEVPYNLQVEVMYALKGME